MPNIYVFLFSVLISVLLFYIIRWLYVDMMSRASLAAYADSATSSIPVYPVSSDWISFQQEINAFNARVAQFGQMIDSYNLLQQKIDTGVSSTGERLCCEILLLSIEIEENLLFDIVRALGMAV